jgi:hypothetical protein
MHATMILNEDVSLEPLSPELVLVSPDLVAEARRRLPEPGAAFWRTPGETGREAEVSPYRPPAWAPRRALAVGDSIGRRILAGAAAAGVTAATVLILTLAADATRDRAAIANANGVLAAGYAQQHITSIFLEWEPVPDAVFYDVRVYERAVKVFETWISEPRFSLPRSWDFEGAQQTLAPGNYRIYILPSVPAISPTPKYGAPVVRTLIVAPNGLARVIYPG